MWNKILVAIAIITMSTMVVACDDKNKDTGDTAGEDTGDTAGEKESE